MELKEQWRILEDFENIAKNEPLFPGDLVCKDYAKRLSRAGLVRKNKKGDYILTGDGRLMWSIYSRLYASYQEG